MTPMDVSGRFEAERERLRSLAYRMVGSPDDAEDVLQDAWLRWSAADHDSIDAPAAWLTTVVTRLAIDRLRSARHRREVYVGPWLPEPLTVDETDPADAVATADSLTLGFLTVLERLAPVERAVFLLHEVFGQPFAEIAPAVDRSEAATRQIAHRARSRVQAEHRRVDTDPRRARELADAFLGACLHGDVGLLATHLTDDVIHLSDGGADVRAARQPVVGPERVARFFVNIAKRMDDGYAVRPLLVNGQPGYLITRAGEPFNLLVPTFRGDQVCAIHAILAPEKLARLA